MKKLLVLLLCLALLLAGCGQQDSPNAEAPTGNISGEEASSSGETAIPERRQDLCPGHVDADENDLCDDCGDSVIVNVDIFAINDLHGKIMDGSSHPGVDELTTYLENAWETADNMVLLSAGDMWQGSAESNATHGELMTQWMNRIGFDAMALGNHEFDWGQDPIAANAEAAQFPFLAINIFDSATHERVPYCEASRLIQLDGIQVGVIGAIGDCYSSISGEHTQGFYFKTGTSLTALVQNEAQALRDAGADAIIYVIHDGLGDTYYDADITVESSRLYSYYGTALSDGSVDVVFEAHTHQIYRFTDESGVYHIQHGGDNNGGISHVELQVDPTAGTAQVVNAQLVSTDVYENLEPDPMVQELLEEYADVLAASFDTIGSLNTSVLGEDLQQKVADLYYMTGILEWGDEYDIVLGGGFISVRSPGYLKRGEVTYAQLQGLFPFDNEIVLCAIQGRDLKEKFLETDNNRYFICTGEYGEEVRQNLDPNATYYVVVDTYTSTYKPNNLTEIARYTPGVYARDLLADFIANGGFN